jgi:hypothetical protein
MPAHSSFELTTAVPAPPEVEGDWTDAPLTSPAQLDDDPADDGDSASDTMPKARVSSAERLAIHVLAGPPFFLP